MSHVVRNWQFAPLLRATSGAPARMGRATRKVPARKPAAPSQAVPNQNTGTRLRSVCAVSSTYVSFSAGSEPRNRPITLRAFTGVASSAAICMLIFQSESPGFKSRSVRVACGSDIRITGVPSTKGKL